MRAYVLTRLRRNPLPYVVLLLLSGVIAGILGELQVICRRMEAEYGAIYQEIDVTCTVTNLTGTQSDLLELPEWVVRLFEEDVTTIGGEALERSFSSYVRDVQVKKARTLGPPYSCSLVGLTSGRMDAALWPENGCEIAWEAGYDETVFGGTEAVCLVPESLAGTEVLAGEISARGETAPVNLKVVGVYTGGSGSIYCPWHYMKELLVSAEGFYGADAVSATVRDNLTLEEFRAYASAWFPAPEASGEPVPWENSPVYSHYPFALDINDRLLEETATSLERGLGLMELAANAILLLSAGAGFFVGCLMIRHRARELVLMQTLGMSKSGIVLQFALEQGLAALTGVLLGGAAFGWRPRLRLALFVALYLAGTLCALLLHLRKNLLREAKGENE